MARFGDDHGSTDPASQTPLALPIACRPARLGSTGALGGCCIGGCPLCRWYQGRARALLHRSRRAYLLRDRRGTCARRPRRWWSRGVVAPLPARRLATMAASARGGRDGRVGYPAVAAISHVLALDDSAARCGRRPCRDVVGCGSPRIPKESRAKKPVSTPDAGRVGDRGTGRPGSPPRVDDGYDRQPIRRLGDSPRRGPDDAARCTRAWRPTRQ